MNIYELEQQAAPGPWADRGLHQHYRNKRMFGPDGACCGYLLSGAFAGKSGGTVDGVEISDAQRDASVALLNHCRNNFMRALKGLKDIRKKQGCGITMSSEWEGRIDRLVKELEEVK